MFFRFMPAAVLALLSSSAFAVPTQAWFRTANLANYDSPQTISVDSVGNFYVVGSVNAVGGYPNIGIWKYSPAGALLWTRTYGAAGYDSVHQVVVAPDNSLVIAGTTQLTQTSDTLGLLVKYSAAGALVFSKTHKGTAPLSYHSYNGVAVSSTGLITAVGQITNNVTGQDAVARQYSASGAILWTRLYSAGGNVANRFQKVVVNAVGDLFTTGTTANAFALVTMKIKGGTGVPLWTKTFTQTGASFSISGLRLDPTGNAAVLAQQYNQPVPQQLVLMEYLSATGAFSLAARRYTPPVGRREYATGFEIDATGAFLLGVDQSWTVGQTYYVQRRVMRVAPTGVTLWTRVLNAITETVEGGPMLVDAQNNVYIAGNLVPQGSQLAKPKMWKYTSAGVLAWTFQPKRGGVMTDLINAMARKSTGEIYTAGYGRPTASAQSSDIVIFKITGG